MTLLCNKPACFSHVNDHDVKLVSIRTTRLTSEKQEALHQSTVTFSLTSTQRPDHYAYYCEMGY